MKNYNRPEIYIKETLSMETIANNIDVTSNTWDTPEDDGTAGDI